MIRTAKSDALSLKVFYGALKSFKELILNIKLDAQFKNYLGTYHAAKVISAVLNRASADENV